MIRAYQNGSRVQKVR